MKRITIAVPLIVAVAIALTGCSTVSGSSDLDPIDLSKSSVIESLDCETATQVTEFVSEAADARANSGQRKSLKEWGVDDPKDDKFLADLVETLEEQTRQACTDDESGDQSSEDSDAKDNKGDQDESDADVSDAESGATLDEGIWGDLDNWEYPEEFAALVTQYGFKTQTVDDQKFPEFKNCTSPTRVGRISTDAITVPLAEKSAKYVFALILSCPAYGGHVLSGLAQDETRLIAGKSLLELNEFLAELKDPAVINDWAQDALEADPEDQLIVAKKLALVVMLLMGIDGDASVEEHSTFLNYHLVVNGEDGVLTIDPSNPFKVREFERNPVQYTGEFVTFAVTFKGQTGCWLQFGFNTGDGRFALFECERPPTAPPPPPPGGDCVINCSPPPGCVYNCYAGKDPNDSGYFGAGEGAEEDAGDGEKEDAYDDGVDLDEPGVTTIEEKKAEEPLLDNEGGDN